ncbi:MAG: hypothetical protein QOE22_443 [Candidatus Parcubacteria bacterium]|jgi:hypothetical protein|nr:hypothetical protein [Candidatus Parcubacteria bacterium]
MFIRYSAGIILLLVLGYGSVKAWPLLRGPEIRLETEVTGSALGVITLSGRALHTETLLLNGGILLIDGEGRFEKTLTLPPGGAILSLTATDRFGRSVYERREVFVP